MNGLSSTSTTMMQSMTFIIYKSEKITMLNNLKFLQHTENWPAGQTASWPHTDHYIHTHKHVSCQSKNRKNTFSNIVKHWKIQSAGNHQQQCQCEQLDSCFLKTSNHFKGSNPHLAYKNYLPPESGDDQI